MSKRKPRRRGLQKLLFVLIFLFIAATGLLIWMCANFVFPDILPEQFRFSIEQSGSLLPEYMPSAQTEPLTAEPPTTEPPTTQPPEPEHVVSRATVVSTGDLLMHGQLINDARKNDGTYDFNYIFPYLTEYITAADFAVANLETTLGGTAKPYQGNPMFNCPDDIVDAAKAAGFDMLLTANNHSYDTQQPGFERTLRTVREKGLVTLGTMLSGDEVKYTVQNINGINIGMICYTYEDSQGPGNPPALNYNPMGSNGYEIINCFRANDPEAFYRDLEAQMALMIEDGAEAIVLYIHWGKEYVLSPIDSQVQMAQRICDLGVDVIVGGHPHVVEPVELLTSSVDPNHKTVCLYSMGNAVSNQRLGKISNIATAHTEDGVLFSLTFSKYSDGTVYLEDADLMPTWVRAIDMNGNTVVRDSGTIIRYEILPLDDSRRDQWQELFGINESTLTQCNDSWKRTMDLTQSGMTSVRSYLLSEKNYRETQYLLAVQNPAA